MQVPDFLQNAETGLKKGAFSALWEISFTNSSERLDFLKKFDIIGLRTGCAGLAAAW